MKADSPNAKPVPNAAAVPSATSTSTRLLVGRRRAAGLTTVLTYTCKPAALPDRVEHDSRKRTLRLIRPDGTTIAFRDQPVRFLVVEPDPKTGEFRPSLSMGRAKVLFLCPEAEESLSVTSCQ